MYILFSDPIAEPTFNLHNRLAELAVQFHLNYELLSSVFMSELCTTFCSVSPLLNRLFNLNLNLGSEMGARSSSETSLVGRLFCTYFL